MGPIATRFAAHLPWTDLEISTLCFFVILEKLVCFKIKNEISIFAR